MTPDEAIKEGNKLKEEFYEIFDEQEHKAIQLGIEALERLKYLREVDNAPNCSSQLNPDIDKLLPSETEEEACNED